MNRDRAQKTLRTALFANAGFSALTAAECLLAPEWVASFVGLSAQQVSGLGIDLAFFVGLLLFTATRPSLATPAMRWLTGGIIAMDVLWVVGSFALLLMPNPLTTAGAWSVAIVALVVAEIAYFQARGWLGLRRQQLPATA